MLQRNLVVVGILLHKYKGQRMPAGHLHYHLRFLVGEPPLLKKLHGCDPVESHQFHFTDCLIYLYITDVVEGNPFPGKDYHIHPLHRRKPLLEGGEEHHNLVRGPVQIIQDQEQGEFPGNVLQDIGYELDIEIHGGLQV